MKDMQGAKYIGLFIIMLISLSAVAQNWAGPDTTVCQGMGTVLGSNSAPDNYCYKWSPATGLSSTTDKRPTAHPAEDIEYTLVAIGPNFSNKVVDKVKVNISTGGVVITPSFTQPDSTANQCHAHLTSKPPGASIKWTIEGDKHGCQINEMTGNISYCHELGDVRIRATDMHNTDCWAEEKLRINVGVKEVFAIDVANPTRKASNGGTLHLVGINNVRLKAIPNTGETFGDDQPDWTGSTIMPPTPHATEWTNGDGAPTSLTITAGQKSVFVSRDPVHEESAGAFSHTLLTLFNAIKGYLKPGADMVKGHSVDSLQTTACKPVDFSFKDHNISVKRTPVNKKDSPDSGWNYTVEGELSGSFTGKVCFPPPYSSVPNPVFVWSTYVLIGGGAKFTGGFSNDESVEVPPKWKSNAANFSSEIKLGIGGEVGLLLPGDLFGITGSVFGGIKIGIDPDFPLPKVTVSSTVEPLVIEGGLKVWYFNPGNTVIDLQGKYNLLDPQMFGPYDFINLANWHL